MNDARSDIFASIRRSLGVHGAEAPRRAAVQERLERAPKGVIPRRGQVGGAERIALFRKQAEAARATTEEIDAISDAPAAIAAYLRARNLPAAIRIGGDLRLRSLPWQNTALEISHGPSDGTDMSAVSHAFAGVAETGSVAMISGPDNPTTLNFLSENHIVILNARDLGGDMEEAWGKLRFAHGKGDMPRAVNFIAGPSCSGDIEQTLLLGAHGPRNLHVVLVKN